MKKARVLSVLALLLAVSLLSSACSSGTAPSQSSQPGTGTGSGAPASGKTVDINVVTGTTTGVYYPLGAGIAQLWSSKVPGVRASAQATNASVQNINLMMKKDAEVGFTTVGVAYYAYHGLDAFKDKAYKDLRVITYLYPNVDQMMVRKDANIQSVADLKGKRYVPGATASATEIDSRYILEMYGLDYINRKDVQPDFVGFTEATDLLRNKQAQGALILAGVPNAAVTEMMASANATMLSLEKDKIDALIKKYPWYYQYTVKAGSYPGLDKDVQTIAQANLLVVRADLPDDLVYQLTKAYWENIKSLESAVKVVKSFKLEEAASNMADIPLHPGAAKYYKEKGIIK